MSDSKPQAYVFIKMFFPAFNKTSAQRSVMSAQLTKNSFVAFSLNKQFNDSIRSKLHTTKFTKDITHNKRFACPTPNAASPDSKIH